MRPKKRKRRHRSNPERKHVVRLLAVAIAPLLAAVLIGWSLWPELSPEASGDEIQLLKIQVVKALGHDPEAFTQGLLWHRGKLYESTGQYGKSSLRRLDPATGEVEKRTALPSAYFGEGLALAGGELVQLTWMEKTAWVFDLNDLQPRRSIPFSGEGWGLTFDGERLIMSDGSDRLTFRDPTDLREIGAVQVTMKGRPLDRLNELEWVDGAVYANVWQEDYIVRIDPKSGRVLARVDAAGLLSQSEASQADVLNGIAYNPQSGSFFVTGKLWPKLFEVRFVTR